MKLKNPGFFRGGLGRLLLQWLNLRPDESDRTLLMFAGHTITAVGLLWLEASTVALFLETIGAEQLPWIYIASAGLGIFVGFLSTWMQTILPLRRYIVVIALLIAMPLLLFRFGLNNLDAQTPDALARLTVFLLPLWVDAAYALNYLNTSITANQLFNIREIKRTFPLISSGALVADVMSGFSLPLLLRVPGVKVQDIIFAAFFILVIGAMLLLYLTRQYQQAFPDAPQRVLDDAHNDTRSRRLKGPLRQYALLLLAFFFIAQVLVLLIDFQFQSRLGVTFKGQEENIASFLAQFNGVLGLCELATQWFVSGRAIERMGVFRTVMFPPAIIAGMGLLTLVGLINTLINLFPPNAWLQSHQNVDQLFIGLVLLKFSDELLRYTLVASTGPVLFQPIPDQQRGSVETQARGISEPIATGLTGAAILLIIGVIGKANEQLLGWIVIGAIVLFALAWLVLIGMLRSRYLDLLVLSAQRGQLGVANVNLKVFKQAVLEALLRPGAEADKRSCIELLSQIDPQNVGEVLGPLLPSLPPALQYQSLEVMQLHPNPTYLTYIRNLIETANPEPDVLAIALRYLWLTETEPDLRQLQPYIQPEVNPVVRGTAAALLLRLGNAKQKWEATRALQQMLTSKKEEERVMGCRALGEAKYLQALRLQIPKLLQDKSLRVRCAVLEVIGSTRLEEYYPSLLRGLEYKSTREPAMRALIKLDNEAIPMVLELATNIHKPDLVRRYAWEVIGEIGTVEALTTLVSNLMTAWGNTRRHILQILLKLPQETGIEAVLDRLDRSGVEMLIDQELMFMGQMYAAILDISPERVTGREADLLRRSLRDAIADSQDRCFLLMKFLYSLGTIQAAAFNLRSGSPSDMARGLEILDQTLDIPSKRVLLTVLDQHSEREKLQSLIGIVAYQPLEASDRLRRLLYLRHFLSDWSSACCFHLARVQEWTLAPELSLGCLRHPTGFVREAVIAYLKQATPGVLLDILPKMQQDPDRLVAAQVQEIMAELGSR
ncbi:MAG TPA: MFS transporter [Cyanobacteria bacterium UBA11369]|nr:MFS transporter [Cyanobacteria bacterium UBA11371]HBE35517.1 MFS transporter [Cyanobacteria bacterium UBA11368]HBE51015.1 MFS transporter [Cyanobacteria bacterium UBA11369]